MKIENLINLIIKKTQLKDKNAKLKNYSSNIPEINIDIDVSKNLNLEDFKYIEEEINLSLENNSFCTCHKTEFQKFQFKNITKNYDNDKKSLISLKTLYFKNNSEYKKYKQNFEKAENNDHRGIGKKLNIFSFDPLIGVGMPIWLEHGTILKKIITNFINKLQQKNEIKLICTPELGSKKLYITSGHFEHYKENMFPEIKLENNEYILRPMTCPHHILIFKKNEHHIKELPIAYGENAKLFRYEHSGGLFGLERVRSMELIDTHIFCSISQIKKTIEWAYLIIKNATKAFDIKLHSVILALKDEKNSKKFFSNNELWNSAESQLKEVLDLLKIKYEIGIGDAAFYGPKIDFQIETYMQKIITISTIQLDFLLPKKFELSFINENQEAEVPVIIHLGIIGTLERFIAYLLEKNSGFLPFWLSPTQIIIIPVIYDKHIEYSKKLKKIFLDKELRAEIDCTKNRLNKKIRNAQIQKIPYQIVIGDNELMDEKFIVYKKYGEHEEETKISISDFLEKLKTENEIPKIDKKV